MTLEQVTHWRKLAGWLGASLCLLAFLALLDGLVGNWREPASLIKLLPATTVEIDGPLQEKVQDTQELIYFTDSEDLKLTLATVHKGYFFGSDLWRGYITAGPRIRPGEYSLKVMPRTSKQAAPAFRIVVYADAVSLQHSSKSVIRRYSGFSAWTVAAFCLPAILLAFAAAFFLSLKFDQFLAQRGKAEIYRVIKREGGYEVHFGLGTANGLQPGVELRVFNLRGKAVGLARVEEASPRDAIALVLTDQEIRPGFLLVK